VIVRILLALLLLHSAIAGAYTGNSLTWQKLALEEKVQRKFNATLGSVLKDNQYIVEVEVEAADPDGPNFGANDKKTGPRVSDLTMGESRGDYIAFSKVGLEVPVLDKFLDEDRTKLMNLYRFNESYDLFKNISGLAVTIYLSDKLPADLIEIAKKLVASTKLAVSGVKPQIKYQSIAMEWVDPEQLKKQADDARARRQAEIEQQKKEKEGPKIWGKDWLEWASRWGNAFGLVLAASIIAYIALSLFREWKAFMEKYAAMQAAKAEPQKDNGKDDAGNDGSPLAAAGKQEDDMAISHGFERFKQCLEQHPDDAVTIVRTWLNEGDDRALLALRSVAQQAAPEDLEKLMAGLSEAQRDKWKGLLGKHLEVPELNAANKHIFQEVVKSFLVPSRIRDGELLNLIMELSPRATGEFLAKNPTQVGILMNILSPSVVGKILGEVDDQTADKWLVEGSQFDLVAMGSHVPPLKEALKAFKLASAPAPFAQRLMTMIPLATPAREGNLYRALARSGNPAMVLEVASKTFPSELVLELPRTFLKEVLQSYPVSKRVEILHSRPEDVRDTLLDVLAEAGTPARDLLDMELENIGRDPGRGATIEARAEEIWQDFVQNSRTVLSKNGSYAAIADQLIKEWASKLGPGLQAIRGGRAA
jgi:hypothetical protein